MSSNTNRMFLAAFVLAISIIGIVMVEDSEKSDAADSFYMEAKDVFNSDYRNFYFDTTSYISITDTLSNENGVLYRYSSNVKTFTVTSSNTHINTTITKTNANTSQEIDFNDQWWDYNSDGYTFNLGVRYYANGGSDPPANQYYYQVGSNVTNITLSNSTPTPPTGATFLGWAFSATATAPDLYPGDLFVKLGEQLTNLYAVYETQTIYTFNLVYDARGGTNAPATQTWSGTATSYTFTISSATPTPPVGSTFYGWNDNPMDDQPYYIGGDTITVTISGGNTTATATLYAIYDLPTYTVTINVNNPSYGSVSPTTVVNVPKYTGITYMNNEMWVGNTHVTVNKNPGYKWVDWTSGGGAAPAWVTSNVTITAVLAQELYTVYFDIDYSPHGSLSRNSIDNIPYGSPITVNGNQITINGTTVTATPDPNYNFSHWYSIVPDTGYNIPSTVTEVSRITAMFTDNRTFTLNYDMKGGTPQIPSDTTTTTASVDSVNFTIYYSEEPTKTGYYLRGWSYSSAATTVDLRELDTVTVTWAGDGGSKTIYAVWEPNAHHIFNLYYDMNGGTPQLETQTYDGSNVTWSHTFFIPNISPTKTGYSFVGWGIEDGSSDPYFYPGGHVTVAYSDGSGDLTLYAIWEEDGPMSSAVYWSNGYANGSVSIAFDFVTTSNNYTHEMIIPLVIYDGIEDDADGIKYFSDSGYTLSIVVPYNGQITCTLSGHGQTISDSFKSGSWVQFTLDVDAQKGTVTFNGTRSLGWNANRDFTFLNYETVFTQKIFDFSSEVTGLAISKIYHEDTGNGMNHPRFQVSATTTFLDTYGFVMIDPTLNIYSQFPNYDNLRLNLYSFAVYGETMTVNGHQFTLQGSRLSDLYYTVYTDDDDNEHYVIANASTEGAVKYDATLSNIYITWTNITSQTVEDRQCYLTFADDKKTIEMGSYPLNDLMISFTGIWYFTTALYEPYTAHETVYSMDWGSWFNLSGDAFLLIIAGLLIILTVAFSMIWKPSIIDYAIIIGSGLISYILIGGL